MGFYDPTIGTMLVGIFFNTYLYGLVTYQFAMYYQTRFDDRLLVKSMVLFLFILDTFSSSSAIYMAWCYTVTDYNNPAAIAVMEWPFALTPVTTSLTALVTQLYLGFRIWKLSKNRVLYGVIILLAIPSFILAVLCSVESWMIKFFSELPRIAPFANAWLTLQAIVDVFIAVTLIVIFSRFRTGFPSTDTVLNRLIRCAIQTGLLVVIFAMGNFVSWVFLPMTDLFSVFVIPIGRVYTITLMDALLGRKALRTELVTILDPDGLLDWSDRLGNSGSPEGNPAIQLASLRIARQAASLGNA